MTFQVKWLNSDDITWEPWANLQNNAVFHEYLRSRTSSLARYIPARFKTEQDVSLAVPKPKDHQGGLTQDHLPDLMLSEIRSPGRIVSSVTDPKEVSSSNDQRPT